MGIDEIGSLGTTISGLVEYPMGVERAASHASETVTVRSGLPAMADEARVGSAQAAVTVPLLMAQMGLLLVCVLWLVLVSAADQRRGEVAVARLRGRGSRGARRLLLGETLPPVVVGAPLGALLAVGLCTRGAADGPHRPTRRSRCRSPRSSRSWPGWRSWSCSRCSRSGASAATPSPTSSAASRRGEPGIRLGVLEAMLVAGAAAAFIALVTGSVQGPVGQLAPTLLALAVGVVAARVLSFLLGIGGRRLLQAGRPTAGAALLASSRRGTTRWLVPVVTVALSIIVVSADALAVGARNWAGRARCGGRGRQRPDR